VLSVPPAEKGIPPGDVSLKPDVPTPAPTPFPTAGSLRLQLPAESLENGQLEWIEYSGFQAEFLGLLEFGARLIIQAFGVMSPGQVEGEARIPGRMLSDRQQVLHGLIDLARSYPSHSTRIGQGRGRSLDLDSTIDQLNRLPSLAVIAE
jgi:hypothetical protein